MSIELTQAEADALIALHKRPSEDTVHRFPLPGDKILIALEPLDKTEDFILSVTKSRINLAKVTFQTRARQACILMRLDLDGPPHRNPDGEVVACPHLHIYREGFGDKWAQPWIADHATTPSTPLQNFYDFLDQCNVVERPSMQLGMF